MADTSPLGWLGALAERTTTQIRAAVGKVTGAPSSAQSPRPLSQQQLRVGPQKPEGVSAILREADQGYMWRLCDLLEEQRTLDCHLQTVCSRRERAVADLPWQVIPASERPRDLRVAAWVEDRLKAFGSDRANGIELRGLPETATHLNAAVIHGYGAAEVPWKRDGRYVVPLGSIPMAPRRFIVSQLDASLRWYDVNGPVTDYPGKDLLRDYPEGRFLVHRPRINGAVISREGLIRPLVWASLFRKWTIQDWLQLAEMAWKPYRLGGYTKDAQPEDVNDLEQALTDLTSRKWATYNKDHSEIEIAYAKNRSAGDGMLHFTLCQFLAGEMSKVTLGATLTVEEGNRGTARTAGVHENVSVEIRDADARGDEMTLQRQLVAPMVRYNFGDVPLPQFRFITEDGADMKALSDAMDKMIGKGLDVPARWLRAQFGIPEPDVGEELVGKGPRKDPNEPEPPPAPQKPADEEGPPTTEEAMRAMRRVFVLDRAMREAGIRKTMRLAA